MSDLLLTSAATGLRYLTTATPKYQGKLTNGVTKEETPEKEYYRKLLVPVRDALEVVNGRWKLPIIISLSLGAKRFNELSRDIPGMTDKMLSKELKNLELNRVVQPDHTQYIPPNS